MTTVRQDGPPNHRQMAAARMKRGTVLMIRSHPVVVGIFRNKTRCLNDRDSGPYSRLQSTTSNHKGSTIRDQDHGSVALTALQTMLLQSEDRKILLLPAWPKNWSVDFKLHAPLQTTVEGSYQDRKLIHLRVTPESRTQDIVFPGWLQ